MSVLLTLTDNTRIVVGVRHSYNKFEYTVGFNNTIRINNVFSFHKALIIPNSLDNKRVVTISSASRSLNLCGVEKVVVSDGINTLDFGCFSFNNFKEIVLPNSITKIRPNVFCNCKKLQEIAIPNRVQCIAKNTFKNCDELKIIHIPRSVKAIEDYAFHGCTNLKVICYDGSVEDWASIDIADSNKDILNKVYILGNGWRYYSKIKLLEFNEDNTLDYING